MLGQHLALLIADRFRDGRWRTQFPNIDGVFAITHKGGCGLPFEGLDHQILERVLAGFAHHPNVAAYVIVGLGCEGAYAQHLVESQHLTLLRAPGNGSQAGRNRPAAPYRPRVLNIQEEGGITRTVEAAVRAVDELMPEANAWRRSEQPASRICLAMECGGSDGNSGVTANPALGVAADLIIAQGGTAVLGETTGNLRRRAPADAAGRQPRGRPEAGRPDQVVGVVHRRLRRPHRQQSVAGQQGRRADHDLREVAGCAGQGRLDAAGRRRRLRRRGDEPRPRLHGHARL